MMIVKEERKWEKESVWLHESVTNVIMFDTEFQIRTFIFVMLLFHANAQAFITSHFKPL